MSYRIMKLHEYKDCVFYRAACMCGSEDCDLTLELEYDKELNCIILHMYKTMSWNEGWELGFFKRFWLRLKSAFRIIFKGYIEVDGDLIIENKRQILEFTSALNSGIKMINENLKED